mmetsp:Transcript_6973/g.15952  ORF Transcript_6973/g.15952 Transcript_6973/m.15952 type:complete len:110 (+) Transcript_6973:1605-1934(+)
MEIPTISIFTLIPVWTWRLLIGGAGPTGRMKGNELCGLSRLEFGFDLVKVNSQPGRQNCEGLRKRCLLEDAAIPQVYRKLFLCSLVQCHSYSRRRRTKQDPTTDISSTR